MSAYSIIMNMYELISALRRLANSLEVLLFLLLSRTMETPEAMLVYSKFDEMAQLIKKCVSLGIQLRLHACM